MGITLEASVGERPEIVCLCGSTRFYDTFQQANYDLTMAGYDTFQQANYDLTMAGKIVLSVGFYPHSKAEHGHGEGVGHDSTEKVALDELHKRKIDLADRVLVLNVGGYIGDSTRSEIAYAEALDKPIDYLETLDGWEPGPPTSTVLGPEGRPGDRTSPAGTPVATTEDRAHEPLATARLHDCDCVPGHRCDCWDYRAARLSSQSVR